MIDFETTKQYYWSCSDCEQHNIVCEALDNCIREIRVFVVKVRITESRVTRMLVP